MTLAGEISTSGGPVLTAIGLVLAVLFGALCYVRTATFRRQIGRNPWGIPPGVWMVIGLLLSLIGLCLAFLACATTRAGPPFGSSGPPPRAYVNPGGGGWAPAPARLPQEPPPGWYPDPSGRHQYRFFTGQDWTADVVDNGVHSTEALPAPPVS